VPDQHYYVEKRSAEKQEREDPPEPEGSMQFSVDSHLNLKENPPKWSWKEKLRSRKGPFFFL